MFYSIYIYIFEPIDLIFYNLPPVTQGLLSATVLNIETYGHSFFMKLSH